MTISTRTKPPRLLPYGRQHITEADIAAVVEVLRSDFLTQGPAIAAFERALAERVGAREVVACVNGTAALHLSMLALGLGPGDRVLTTPITFLADANCARYVGADVVFADIDPATGLIDPESVAQVLADDKKRTIKAVIPVDFAGQPADLQALSGMALAHGASVVDDACHAIGASYRSGGREISLGAGVHSDLTVFSFHPVKHVAMGEGGAIATNDESLAARLRLFRNHGMQKEDIIQTELGQAGDGSMNPWYYEMQDLGYNYRVSDMQAALGLSQLARLDQSVRKRRQLAARYTELIGARFAREEVAPLSLAPDVAHAWHLYVVQINFEQLGIPRADVMHRLREANIGTQVHYIPIHLQPYYRSRNGFKPGQLPRAEAYYQRALSLPMYPDLGDDDIEYIVETLETILRRRA